MAKGTRDSKWSVAFRADTGNHMPYDNGYSTPPKLLRHAHITWDDRLEYVRYERGRSSVTVILRAADSGPEYSMFFAEFMRLLPLFERGEISGRWGFEKNGRNTGIYRL